MSKTARPSKIVPRPGEDAAPPRRVNTGAAAEKRHLGRVAAMSCVLCERLGLPQQGRTYVHHARTGQGKSQRASHYLGIPLCYDCHQGQNGIHGDRSLLRIAKCEELDLLADVIKKLSEMNS